MKQEVRLGNLYSSFPGADPYSWESVPHCVTQAHLKAFCEVRQPTICSGFRDRPQQFRFHFVILKAHPKPSAGPWAQSTQDAGCDAQHNASKWGLLMWMGVSTLHASNIKGKTFASRPASCVDWAFALFWKQFSSESVSAPKHTSANPYRHSFHWTTTLCEKGEKKRKLKTNQIVCFLLGECKSEWAVTQSVREARGKGSPGFTPRAAFASHLPWSLHHKL